MANDERIVEQENTEKPLSKWKKWLIFWLLGIVANVFGQGLVDLGFIGNKWWLITSVTVVVYWSLFLRKVN